LAEDGKPLEEKKAAQVEKDLAEAKAERRQRRSLRRIERKVHFSGLRDLPRYYDLSLREGMSPSGVEAWKIKAKVKQRLGKESEEEMRAHAVESTIWIAKQDFALAAREDQFKQSFNSFEPGSKVLFEYLRIREECWMLTSIRMDVKLKAMKMIRTNLQSQQTYSEFRKFDVESTISLP
jgi:hypothetical protein